jgi:hypothetical protein
MKREGRSATSKAEDGKRQNQFVDIRAIRVKNLIACLIDFSFLLSQFLFFR